VSSAAGSPSPEYESELRDILAARDWEKLRDFSRAHNEIPDEVFEQPQHFWEVMLHKLTCGRIDLLGLHEDSRRWLSERGYTPDLGGY
jgi:hypothetical protein